MNQSAQKGLIWLASYPKSGNTWTRTFLHNLLFFMRGEADGEWDINKLNEFSTSSQSMARYEKLSGKAWPDISRREIAALRGKVQEETSENASGLAFVKTHNGLMLDRDYPTINFAVTTGAVYIIRNPLDVAISYSHHLSCSIDRAIEIMGTPHYETKGSERQVHEVMGSWSEHVESWAGKPHRAIHVMRYEDMLSNPQRVFGSLAKFLLLRPSENDLNKAIEASSFETLQKQEAEKGFREKPEKAEKFFRSGKTDQWQEFLNKEQIKKIVSDHGMVMSIFDYIPEGYGDFSKSCRSMMMKRQ